MHYLQCALWVIFWRSAGWLLDEGWVERGLVLVGEESYVPT